MTYQVVAALDEALPDGWVLERAAGPASRQTQAAADATTFIEKWLAGNENVPRFSYVPALGARGLLVEPARTNLNPESDFLDATNDEIPDGWTVGSGAQVTDWTCDPAGPHGGLVWHRNNTANNPVCQVAATLADPGTYISSAWVRATGLGAAKTLLTYGRSGVWFEGIALTAGTYGWTHHRGAAAATPGTAGDIAYMSQLGSPGGTFDAALFQVEAGVCPSSWIPTTGGAGTRGAERCRFTGARELGSWWRKRIQIDVAPTYGSTAAVGTPRLFGMTANDYIAFQAADDRIIVVNGGSIVAQSAPLVFAAGDRLSLVIEFSPYTTCLDVNGVRTDSGGTGWVAPASVTPHLGSDVAGANSQPAVYRRLAVF